MSEKLPPHDMWIDKRKARMSVATAAFSSRYQISIPEDTRHAMHFTPGQQLAFLQVGKGLRLVPVCKTEDFVGKPKGAGTENYRDRSTRREYKLPAPTAAQIAAMQKRLAKGQRQA